MRTIESLRRQINSAQDLHSVVRTMKALAAVSIRQYEKAVESLLEYNRAVEMGFQVLLKERPPEVAITQPEPAGRFGAIVFGSDQGMVGQFNEAIAQHVASEINARQVRREKLGLLAVGLRIFSRLEEAGQPVEQHVSLPDSVAGITALVHDMVLRIERWRSERDINQVVLFYNKPVSGASYRPHTLQLLPVDLDWFQDLERRHWPCRSLPLFTMSWNRLFSLLIREYFFVSLYRACAESLASENTSRLASMQVAERNIEDLLHQLHAGFHQKRQSAIDEELFDLVAGFEALTSNTT